MSVDLYPEQIKYRGAKPKGIPQISRQVRYTPVQSFTGYQPYEQVRFVFNTDGYWDPQSAIVMIEVEVDPTVIAPGALQVDGSAASFISELVMTVENQEIERISQYDTLACVLNDLHVDEPVRKDLVYSGTNARTITKRNNSQPICTTVIKDGATNLIAGGDKVFNQRGMYDPNSLVSSGSTSTGYSSNFLSTFSATASMSALSPAQTLATDIAAAKTAFVRCEYNYPPDFGVNYATDNKITTPIFQHYEDDLSQASTEFQFNSAASTSLIYKGKMLSGSTVRKVTKQQFFCPLYSALFGILQSDYDSYKLLPMKYFTNLVMDFRLSPYAMFSSGYTDTSLDIDKTLTAANSISQIPRSWTVRKFEILVDMYYFDDIVEKALSDMIASSGLTLNTVCYELGPTTTIASTANVKNNWVINSGHQSLKMLMWFFLADDYLSYSFCRKQFRLSHNITSFQIRLGNEYFPQQPIKGHAGQVVTAIAGQTNTNTDYNNSAYLLQLLKCISSMWDYSKSIVINPSNFALNDRVYNPTNTGTFWETVRGTYNYNLDTALGYPSFHENRAVGKAIYAYKFESAKDNINQISGINTIPYRPYELILDVDSSENQFTRPSTMMMYFVVDALYIIRPGGIELRK